VGSIRVIVGAIVAAIQSGLAQRDTRRAERGAAQTAAVNAAANAAIASADQIDLPKVDLPPGVAAAVEGEAEPTVAKKPIRAKKAAVKAE